MQTKEFLLVVFTCSLIFHWFWCLFFAYPIILDKCIRRGQSWLYIPLKWKGANKAVISLLTPVIIFFLTLLGIGTLHFYLKSLPVIYFITSSLILCCALIFLHYLWLKIRFHQQEDAYFFIRKQVSHKMEKDGKRLSETEINNLASFQHQNLLREADMQGKLKEVLTTQSILAKKKITSIK